MAGIFLTRGMAIGIPTGGLSLSIDDEGQVKGSLTLHLRFDVCPTWVELSLRHLTAATEARSARQVAWAGTNEDAKAAALEREFEASMQAIMAAAICLDAFYAVLQQHVVLTPKLLEHWRTGRTPRFSQIAEVIRRAFHLKKNGTANLREMLKEIYRVRGLAVHPPGKIEAPIYHSELDINVEWRFAYFTAANAEQIANAATWILWDLCHGGKPADAKILDYSSNLKQRLIALFPDGHPSATTAVPPSGRQSIDPAT